MKATSLRAIFPRRWDFPDSPNTLAFVVALVEDIVLPHVALGPVTFAIGEEIRPAHDEIAYVVPASAGHLSLLKGEVQLHQMTPRDSRLKKIAGPRAAGEAGIGFQLCRCRWLHFLCPISQGQLLACQ